MLLANACSPYSWIWRRNRNHCGCNRHEIDAIDFKRKSFGNTYALGRQTNDPRELAKLLMNLCERQANMEKWARLCLQKSSAKAETCAATFAKPNRQSIMLYAFMP
jgi:hypothetical protein